MKMLDRDVIQGRGFHNVVDENGEVTGFRFDLRNPNYRGTAASLLDGIDVRVDDETWPEDAATWTLGGRSYSLAELRDSESLRWNLDETATVTVPRPGGLAPGVHDVEVTIYLRRPYFPPAINRSAFPARAARVTVPATGPDLDGIRLAASTYSYSADIYTSMTLEDVFADIADVGATGIEILGEGNVPGYPHPSSTWVDEWHHLLAQYALTATNFGGWVDTAMWRERDLTEEEAADQLRQDLRLAALLGFTSLRPKFGVTSWDLDPHPVWSGAVERVLDLATELDVLICPEIHSPTPIKHPVTQAYLAFIEKVGSPHFKLLIDTGIFQTAPVDDGHDGVEVEEGKKRPAFLEPLRVPASDLAEILPHVHFIQAKFFEIDDDLHDLHVPWDEVLGVLVAGGWKGWLSSEYEGRRDPYRGRDQVRRQHALLRQALARQR